MGEDVKTVKANHQSIKQEIDRNIKDPFSAFNEFIWNSLDAKSTEIKISVKHDTRFITELKIKDNGEGINLDKLEKELFGNLNVSPKAEDNEKEHSLPHGKNGFGRFSFILFSDEAKWSTCYTDKSINKKISYGITIRKDSLDKYNISEKQEDEKNTGTEVSFKFEGMNGSDLLSSGQDYLSKLKKSIALEFGWIIELFNVKIIINDQTINTEEIVEEKLLEETINVGEETINLKFIKWKNPIPRQHSRCYFLKSTGEEAFVRTTGLSGKGDEFYHSIYVKGKIFDNYKDADKFNFLYGKIFQDTWEKISNFLKEKRKKFIEKFSKEKYEEFEKKELTPKFNPFESQIKKPIYREIVREIIEFAPTLATQSNEPQKKIFLQLINKLLDDEKSRDNLYEILEVLVNDENKHLLEELKIKLKKYGLKNILGTIKLIEDRIKTIENIKTMFEKEENYVLKEDFSESDLQKVINDHFWIFGEEYNLLVASEEEDFNKLYKNYCEKVQKETVKDFREKYSKKQVDLFITGETPEGRRKKHLIVEIKKPNLNLKKENYSQLEDYKEEIKKIPEFNSSERHAWNFVLLYRDVSPDHKAYFDGKIKDKFTGETKDSEENMRIFVIKWNSLLEDCEFRLKFLKDKLNLKKEGIIRDKDSILSNLNNDAKIVS